MKKILDIYHGETITSYDKVASDVEVFIHKMTEGTSFIDNKAKARFEAMEERKVPYWGYTFLKRGNEVEQVKFMIKNFEYLLKKKYFVGFILDVECGNSATNIRKAYDYLLAYCKKNNCKMGVYMSQSVEREHIKLINDLDKNYCFWWTARYWSKAVMQPYTDVWQYTDDGRCNGMNDAIDLSIMVNGKSVNWLKDRHVTAKDKPVLVYTGTLRNPVNVYKKGYSQRGDNGDFVKELQKFLNWYCSAGLVVDGKFGTLTEKCVKQFQKDTGITVDGKFGKASYNKATATHKRTKAYVPK